MAKYKNIWYNRNDIHSGPEYYTTDVTPVEYKGYRIYERVKGEVWDVVLVLHGEDHICLMQRAGLGGAKRAIDEHIQDMMDLVKEVVGEM